MGVSHTRKALEAMTVSQIRELVRAHNYHVAIKRYSSMRKAELIAAFRKHDARVGGKTKARPGKAGSDPKQKRIEQFKAKPKGTSFGSRDGSGRRYPYTKRS